MTVKCVGIWEKGWNIPIQEFDLWRMVMREYEVDEWIMTPVSGIVATKIKEAPDVQSVIDANPTLTPIYIDEGSGGTLSEFVHPENCLYIFGRTSLSVWRMAGKPENCIKFITPANKALLWAHQSAVVVLHDRFLKS
jgi:hypothetical protein